jgi:hypothetical protein
MTSSFRDGKKYEQLTVILHTWISYRIDASANPIASTVSNLEIKNLRFTSDWTPFAVANLLFTPYQLWCGISDGSNSWNILYFDLTIPENGKQYCFEIASETCKLIEQRCE